MKTFLFILNSISGWINLQLCVCANVCALNLQHCDPNLVTKWMGLMINERNRSEMSREISLSWMCYEIIRMQVSPSSNKTILFGPNALTLTSSDTKFRNSFCSDKQNATYEIIQWKHHPSHQRCSSHCIHPQIIYTTNFWCAVAMHSRIAHSAHCSPTSFRSLLSSIVLLLLLLLFRPHSFFGRCHWWWM